MKILYMPLYKLCNITIESDYILWYNCNVKVYAGGVIYLSTFENFMQFIKEKGWIIEEADGKGHMLPEVYRGKTGYFEEIADKYSVIMNAEENVWFTVGETLEDEKSFEDEGPFRWNTFMNMCINTSDDGGKTEREWWDKRFPFLLSVKYGEYEFFAVNTDDGSVEYGFEPLFEETEKVADSLDDFFNKAVSGEIGNLLYRNYFSDDEQEYD